MEKSNELKKVALDSMPRSKEHWPLAVWFAVSFTTMLVLACACSPLAVPAGVLTLILSKRMEKAGVEVEE